MIAYLVLFGRSVDVPQADCVVVRRRQQVPVKVRVPGQTVSFLLVASQAVRHFNYLIVKEI